MFFPGWRASVLPWMNDDDRRRMQEISERLGRGLEDLDGSIARTAVLSDEISSLMADAMNRRTYTMSLLAMVFFTDNISDWVIWRQSGRDTW